MFHNEEVVDLFKEFIAKNSYQGFKGKNKVLELCDELYNRYDYEYEGLCGLLEEGLGELLPEALLTNRHDIAKVEYNIKQFISSKEYSFLWYIVVQRILEKVFYGKLDDYDTIKELWDIQRKKDESYQRERLQKICIEKKEDWKQVFDQTKTEVTLSSQYTGKVLPLELLEGIKKFSNFFPISYATFKKLDLSQMEEMCCSIIDENEDIVIDAPHLRRLRIVISDNIYEQLTPLERMMQFQKKIIDISDAEELEELTINHSSGYTVVTKGKLMNLKKISQTYELINDLEWMEEIPSLEQYITYGGNMDDIDCIPQLNNLNLLKIESHELKTIDNIKRYPKLKELSVRGNEIYSIEKSDIFEQLERLDLRKNVVATKILKEELNIPEVFLTELDYEITRLKDVFDRLFYLAYKSAKENKLGLLKFKSELERFVIVSNSLFKQEQNTLRIYNDEISTRKLKEAFIQYASEHYDFLDVNEEYSFD